ncbi:MAG: TrmH family RNA methyltransferase [Myxococcota bacterium]
MANEDTETLNPRFPHRDPFEVQGHTLSARQIIGLLEDQMTDRRRQRINTVVEGRTYDVATVFDGPYDRGNVSAVIRTAEGLGFGPLHVVETQEEFKEANRVTQGADKWLDIFKWKTPGECVTHLKDRGYRIVSTHLEASKPIDEIDFSAPTAMVFGNERDGVSDEVLEASDARCIIPMPGFSQSFNISVAAALTLYHIYRFRVDNLGGHGSLSDREKELLRASFYLRGINQPDRLIPNLLDRLGVDEPGV